MTGAVCCCDVALIFLLGYRLTSWVIPVAAKPLPVSLVE